jgi:hypothetical protein
VKSIRSLCIVVLLAGCAGCGGGIGPDRDQPAVEFIHIGTLPSDRSSQATAVSTDGTVIVGDGNARNPSPHGLLWLEGVIKTDYQTAIPGWLLARVEHQPA